MSAPVEPDVQPGEGMPDDHIDLTGLIEAVHAGAMLCKGAQTGEDYQKAATGVKALMDAIGELTAQPQDAQPDHSLETAALDAQTKLTLADKQGATEIDKAQMAREAEIEKARIAAQAQRDTAEISASAQRHAAEQHAKAARKTVNVKRDQQGNAVQYEQG